MKSNSEYLEFNNEMSTTICRHFNGSAIRMDEICPKGACYLNGCQDEALEYIETNLVKPLITSCFIGVVVYSM